jgi:hypothetical protein
VEAATAKDGFMKNKFLLPGMLIGLLTFSLTVFGCEDGSTDDDDDGGGGGLTVSFAAAGENAFTLTLSKGAWGTEFPAYAFGVSKAFYTISNKANGLEEVETSDDYLASVMNNRDSLNTKIIKLSLSRIDVNYGTFDICLNTAAEGKAALQALLTTSYVVSGITGDDITALTYEAGTPVTIDFVGY